MDILKIDYSMENQKKITIPTICSILTFNRGGATLFFIEKNKEICTIKITPRVMKPFASDCTNRANLKFFYGIMSVLLQGIKQEEFFEKLQLL